MFEIPGYKILEKIYQGRYSVIYHGLKLNEGPQPVLIKVPYPNIQEADKLRHEFKILQHVTSEHVLKFSELQDDSNYGCILIGIDEPIEALSHLIPENGLEFSNFFNIALQLAEGLYEMHQGNIVHNNISLDNIIFQSASGKVKYINFDTAFPLHQIKQITISPSLPMNSLSYISPEQTGRTNRRLDYRTDFYSLGVVLYQLLCGQLPFKVEDKLQIIHSHVAKQPRAPHEMKPSIPEPLSDMVMKLLKKDAEDRYQSAWSIFIDLKKCFDDLKTTGEIKPFILAQQDIPERFHVLQKVYGREHEISILNQAFEEISSQEKDHKRQVIMVTGPAGSGKSTLVNEIQTSIAFRKGYFLSGKFDQAHYKVAYSAITQAFQMWVKQIILTSDDEKILAWKNQLLAAMGSNAPMLIKVIPNLEWIIGKQPSILIDASPQSKNRFHLAFKNFILELAQPEYPLVLFLDDWQWADEESLNLLAVLMTDPDIRHLLLIGSYRANEIEAEHPILSTLAAIQKAGVTIQTIPLQPLTEAMIEQWVVESMHRPREIVRPLAYLLYQKTDGNPFFLRVFLQNLYERQLLKLTQEGWECDMESIYRMYASDNNIDDFLEHRIQNLSIKAQEILKFSSCLRQYFEPDVVSKISQIDSEQTLYELQELVDNGLLLQIDDNFQFVHDRVRGAVYSLIPFEKRAALHLSIGRWLQAELSAEPSPELIFEVVNHLNEGSNLMRDPAERIELAQLNLIAAKKAKETIAYAAALNYLKINLSYFAVQDIWKKHSALAYELFKELFEVEYLNGHFDESTKYADLLFNHVHHPIERAEIYALLIIQETMQAHYSKAINLGYQALNLLGVRLSEDRLPQLLQVEIEAAKENWRGKTIDIVLNAPEIEHLNLKAMLKLMNSLISPAFIVNQTLYQLLVTKSVNISLNYGCSKESIMGYVTHGTLLCTHFNDIPLGHQFGLIAMELSNRFQSPIDLCQSSFMYVAFIHHWAKPLKQSIQFIEAGERSGLESGELLFLGYNSMCQPFNSFYDGTPLAKVYIDINKYLQTYYATRNQLMISFLHAVRLVVLNLMGHTQGNTFFHDLYQDEHEYQVNWQEEKHFNVLTHYLVLKAQALYFYGYFEQALEMLNSTKSNLMFVSGTFAIAAYNYYYSLSLAALYPTAAQDKQLFYWQQLQENQGQMKIWADHCPENFLHKYLLIAAEMARLEGKDILEIAELYDQAIQSAQEQGFIPEQSLACELAARFWLSKGRTRCAKAYLNDAYQGYFHWGSQRKTAMLIRQYPELLKSVSKPLTNHFSMSSELMITDSDLTLIDLASILKASQTISSEIEFPKLLSKMMQVIVENAGAQKGAFWLEEADGLRLQAEYKSEKHIQTLQKLPLARWENGPRSLIDYVKRTRQMVFLGDASRDPEFSQDPFINAHGVKSILCVPLLQKQRLKGIMYLENNLLSYAFTEKHQQILTILAAQIAISLENAVLYESMRLMTERFNLALQIGNVGIWDWNIQENKVRWDESMYELYGVNKEEFSHTLESFIELIHPDDRENVEQVIKQVLTASVPYHLEYRIIRPSDHRIHVIISHGKVYQNEQGQAEHMIGTSWNITERKQLEEERLQALKQAEEKEHQRAEDAEKYRGEQVEFIDTVCHEIRNPMNGIYGNIDSLKQMADSLKHLRDSSPMDFRAPIEEIQYKFEEIINVIEQCIKHQKIIIDDVLSLSKLETGKSVLASKPFLPKILIEDTLRIYETSLAAKHLTLQLSLPEQAVIVLGDPDRFKIIIMNLISNAIKFTATGEIKVSLCMQAESSNQVNLIFSVEDTGIGMSQEQQLKLFQRFSRPASSQYQFEGSGLGLAIIKKIVDLMGGKIQLESKLGQGSRFTIYLTCESPKVEAATNFLMSKETVTSTSAALTAVTEKNILIVEDNLINQKILKKQLEQAGYRCTFADNGQEALEKWQQMNFDLILMDRQMPIMDGLQATKLIRAQEKALNKMPIPIIGLSAYTRDELVHEGLTAGMNAYLTKPYEKEKILNAIQKWITASRDQSMSTLEASSEIKSAIETDEKTLPVFKKLSVPPHQKSARLMIFQEESSQPSLFEESRCSKRLSP